MSVAVEELKMLPANAIGMCIVRGGKITSDELHGLARHLASLNERLVTLHLSGGVQLDALDYPSTMRLVSMLTDHLDRDDLATLGLKRVLT